MWDGVVTTRCVRLITVCTLCVLPTGVTLGEKRYNLVREIGHRVYFLFYWPVLCGNVTNKAFKTSHCEYVVCFIDRCDVVVWLGAQRYNQVFKTSHCVYVVWQVWRGEHNGTTRAVRQDSVSRVSSVRKQPFVVSCLSPTLWSVWLYLAIEEVVFGKVINDKISSLSL